MNTKLNELLRFVEFTNLFADIKRTTIVNKDGSSENDAQHSFQLAIVAWYINERECLNLDNEKLIKYALVHDLVETFSGSSPAYSRTAESQKSKEQMEKDALKKSGRISQIFLL